MTLERYFVHEGELTEGPLDMPMVMRKIRAGKLTFNTELSKEHENIRGVAGEFPEIAAMLRENVSKAAARSGPERRGKGIPAEQRIKRALKTGWRFIGQNPQVFILSSIGVFVAFGGPMLLSAAIPAQICLLIGAFIFMVLQSVMMVTALRIYRGQYPNAYYIRTQLMPIIPMLVTAAIVTSLIGAFGLVLFVLPGIALFALFSFVPLFIADRKLPLTQALDASRKAVLRDGLESLSAVMALVTINLLSMLFIITLPVTLPVIAVALADLYEDMAY